MKQVIQFIKRKCFQLKNRAPSVNAETGCVRYTRDMHTLSRAQLSKAALKVLYRLKEASYSAYLVGGGVRDSLIGRMPKDFDVATDATPEQVHALFRNSRIIGRRFRLVHVYYRHGEYIEVSTFRANQAGKTQDAAAGLSMITCDNTYGTVVEDARRRDFTVNALYYNIADFSVIDHVGGMQDLEKKCIRMIGDPLVRFHEDPVRMLRAIRLSAKLDFRIDAATYAQLKASAHLLEKVAPARLLDEFIKLFFEGYAEHSFNVLMKTNYIPVLLPSLSPVLSGNMQSSALELIRAGLVKTDQRYAQKQRITPAYLLAVFLWPVLRTHMKQAQSESMRFAKALHYAVEKTLHPANTLFSVTRKMRVMMQSMWTLQYHLDLRRPRRVYHLIQQRYYRAAFDLMALRAEAGEADPEKVDWWQRFYESSSKVRQKMLEALR